RGGEQVGALAALVGHQGEAEAAVERVEIELPDEHADRAGDGGWFGIDLIGRDRHVVAAGRGDVAHAGDDRLVLVLASADELPPDEVGGRPVPAGRVDAHDDGADRGIVGEPVDAARDGVGSGDLDPAKGGGT